MNGEDAATHQARGAASATTQNNNVDSNSGSAAAAASGGTTAAKPAAKPSKGTGKMNPPTLEGKYEMLKPVVEPQRAKLQWTMFKSAKSMLGHYKENCLRVEAYRLHEGTYDDVNDLDEDGKAKKKPFVPHSLRYTNDLHCSKWVKKDGRVKDYLARIESEIGAGDKLYDEFKQKLAQRSKNIAELESKARLHAIAIEYYNTLYKVGGGLALSLYAEGTDPDTTPSRLAHAVVKATMDLLNEAHITALGIVSDSEDNITGGIEDILWGEYQKHRGINYETDIQPHVKEGDFANIATAASKLAEAMPVLTTELWEHQRKVKHDLKVDAALESFLDEEEIDEANTELGDAMEVDEGEALNPFPPRVAFGGRFAFMYIKSLVVGRFT